MLTRARSGHCKSRSQGSCCSGPESTTNVANVMCLNVMCLKDGEPANHPRAHTQLNGGRLEATAGRQSSREQLFPGSSPPEQLPLARAPAPSDSQTLSPASFFDCARSTSIRLSSYSFCMLAT